MGLSSTSNWTRSQRIAAGIAALVFGAALAPGHASAAPQGAPPPDVVANSLDGAYIESTRCDGTTTTQINSGFLEVERPNATSGTISVDVTYGGTLVAGSDYEPLPDPITIEAGSASTILTVTPTAAGTITMTVEPGTGYNVGDPATATVTFPMIQSSTACPATVKQTIESGTAPDPIPVLDYAGSEIFDSLFTIEGDVPPGLTLNHDGTWTGTASTVGVYDFTARYCIVVDTCALELPVQITVVPVDAQIPIGEPDAPAPAAPITNSPSYTG